MRTWALGNAGAMTVGIALGAASLVSNAHAANELCGQTITQSVTFNATPRKPAPR